MNAQTTFTLHWWQDSFYQMLGVMGLVALVLFVWAMQHLARTEDERRVFAPEVGGLACWLSGLLIGLVMMTLVFQLDGVMGAGVAY